VRQYDPILYGMVIKNIGWGDRSQKLEGNRQSATVDLPCPLVFLVSPISLFPTPHTPNPTPYHQKKTGAEMPREFIPGRNRDAGGFNRLSNLISFKIQGREKKLMIWVRKLIFFISGDVQ
jgi:hypothetical protein